MGLQETGCAEEFGETLLGTPWAGPEAFFSDVSALPLFTRWAWQASSSLGNQTGRFNGSRVWDAGSL